MCKCVVELSKPPKHEVITLFGGYKKTCTTHNRVWYGSGTGGCCALSEKEREECKKVSQ